MIDDGNLDGAGAAGLADASNDAAAIQHPRNAVGGETIEIEAVTGFRSDARVRWRAPAGLSGGARVYEDGVSGFVRFEGKGIVRAVHAGRIAVRAAERLVLGRGMGAYALDGSGPVRGGFAARPSFSRWYGYPGMAAAFEWRGWRADTIALGRAAENSLSPATWWTSISRNLWGGRWGAVVGVPVSGVPAGAAEAEERDPEPESPRVVSFAAALSVGRVAASAELARTSDRMFFAIRFVSRERGTGRRWSALFFDAPNASPLGESGLERVGRSDRGTRFDLACPAGPVGCEAWMAAGRTRSDSRQTAYRRLSLQFSPRRPRSVWWQAVVLYRRGCEEVYPSSPVEVDITGETTRELRVRAAVGIRNGPAVSSSVRADFLPTCGGAGHGVVLVLSTEIASGSVDARLQVAAHSLPTGRSATVWRPGVGPFEWFAPLYGKGSDVALRAGVRVGRAARFVFFYGSSWSGTARAYAGLEYRR